MTDTFWTSRKGCVSCVITTIICFVALSLHLTGNLKTSRLLIFFAGNETIFIDRNGSSTVPKQRLDDSLETQQNEEAPRSNWLIRTHWKSEIDHHEYQYLINPKVKCEVSNGLVGSSRNLTLLVLVKSATYDSELRDAIRSTYMQGALKYNVSCRIFFLLGFPAQDERKQAEIIKEAGTHGDIIQEDFIDSYYNLTIKQIMAFKWAMKFCKNSQFVLSTDDDVMFDIVTLVDDLATSPQEYHWEFVLGQLTRGAGPSRNKQSKWYTPKTLYPLDKYPTYPQGHGYVISQDIIPRIFNASQELPPPVPWDDVYFGALLNKLKISITDRKPWYGKRHHKDKAATPDPVFPQDDYFKKDLSVDEMKTFWNAIESELNVNAKKKKTHYSSIFQLR